MVLSRLCLESKTEQIAEGITLQIVLMRKSYMSDRLRSAAVCTACLRATDWLITTLMSGCLTAVLSCRTKNIVQAAVQKRNSEALSAMTFAATLGDVDSMEHLLQRGLLINTADYDGRTTLHLAALEGNVKVLELLLQEGADPNVRDRYELR